jgi:hypothetical protein
MQFPAVSAHGEKTRTERSGAVSYSCPRIKSTGHAAAWLLACACLAAAALVYVGCTSLDSLAGTGSQAGNGRVTCVVYNSDGSPASGATVRLRPSDYIADTAGSSLGKRAVCRRDAITDAHGSFSIDSVDTGSYCIEVNDSKSHAVLLFCTVSIKNPQVRLSGDTLRPTGSISGVLVSAPDRAVALYVQIYGLERVGVRDAATGKFVVRDVPRGSYRVRVLASSAEYRPVEIDKVILASSKGADVGKIDFLHLSQWAYLRRCYLNTTPTGAGVAGTVTNFPVLIRFRADNFDFSQAKADGGDIRFTKEDGASLPYEIERWDVENKQAAIWVKADTVYGNSSSRWIALYWGNPGALDSSNAGKVFDTASDFQGVWHLGDTPGDSVRDATVNNYNGVSPDTARPGVAGGAIGNCRAFDGIADFITMPNTASGRLDFPEHGSYSVSAWVMADTFNDIQQTLVSKGRFQYFLWIDSTTWDFWEYQDWTGWEASAQKATLKQWVLLTGVRDGARQYLYVNGETVDSIFLKSNAGPRNSTSDLNVGRAHELATTSKTYSNPCYFKGKMDEVRISSVARSTDWVRLCYMNQREDDKLVVFK